MCLCALDTNSLCAENVRRNVENMQKNILCFGDSNTHGYNSKTGGRFDVNERWTKLLQKNLGDDYYIIEEGLSGRTTSFEDPVFEGLCGLNVIYPCMMSHEPLDLVIIMLGTNDTKDRFNANSFIIGKGLERLAQKTIDTHAAWRGAPNVLLIAPPPIHPDYAKTAVAGEMGDKCVERSRGLAKEFKEVADRLHCHFLDAGSIPGIEMYPYDWMHLSLESHKLLADELTKVMKEIL